MTHQQLCEAALERVYEAKDSGDRQKQREAWQAFAALVNSRPREDVERMERERGLI